MSSCSSPEPDFRSGLCTPPPSPPSPLSSAAFPSHAKWKLCAATLESQSHPSHLFRPFTSSLSFSFSASTSLSYPWRSASISFSYSSLQLSFCPRRHPWMSLLEWRPSVPDKCLCVCVRVCACACVRVRRHTWHMSCSICRVIFWCSCSEQSKGRCAGWRFSLYH